ncbi:TrkA-C domain-containing protein [Nocardia nova SH22a]|uniref:TrkA-C domain-containing protein n=1 Tax=Nocardia nova SH22a TaxID=1415166 RepID=W5TL52_9NOCA|nr:TrkA C-terminal domain-containing protein [Nocardia nova]AHH19703.1 TrkA-C domain-containing protein [Nocardia nova SH22a]
MNVEVTSLPGIGIRKEFALSHNARRVGVIDHKDGTLDLLISKRGDPDGTEQITMTGPEATVLANLLGAPQLVAQLEEEHRELEGLATKQFSIRANSVYDGRPLGDTQMRSRTTASIVAVMRAGQPLASPGPEFVFTAGDVLVVVGTVDGLTAAARILTDG